MEMIKEFKTISRKIAKRYSVRDIDSFWKAILVREKRRLYLEKIKVQ